MKVSRWKPWWFSCGVRTFMKLVLLALCRQIIGKPMAWWCCRGYFFFASMVYPFRVKKQCKSETEEVLLTEHLYSMVKHFYRDGSGLFQCPGWSRSHPEDENGVNHMRWTLHSLATQLNNYGSFCSTMFVYIFFYWKWQFWLSYLILF